LVLLYLFHESFNTQKIRRILEDEITNKKKGKLDNQYWTCPKCGFSKNL